MLLTNLLWSQHVIKSPCLILFCDQPHLSIHPFKLSSFYTCIFLQHHYCSSSIASHLALKNILHVFVLLVLYFSFKVFSFTCLKGTNWQKKIRNLVCLHIFNSEVKPDTKLWVTRVRPNEQIIFKISYVINTPKVSCPKNNQVIKLKWSQKFQSLFKFKSAKRCLKFFLKVIMN